MTKTEEGIINKFLLRIIHETYNKNIKYVNGKIFDKNAKDFTAVIRITDILKEWKKIRIKLEKKNGK